MSEPAGEPSTPSEPASEPSTPSEPAEPSTGDGFTVDPDVLAGHAERVTGHAGVVREVAGAAQPLGLDAYGVIGRGFARGAVAAAHQVSATVSALSDVAEEHASGLRGCVAEYVLAERGNTALFGAPS